MQLKQLLIELIHRSGYRVIGRDIKIDIHGKVSKFDYFLYRDSDRKLTTITVLNWRRTVPFLVVNKHLQAIRVILSEYRELLSKVNEIEIIIIANNFSSSAYYFANREDLKALGRKVRIKLITDGEVVSLVRGKYRELDSVIQRILNT